MNSVHIIKKVGYDPRFLKNRKRNVHYFLATECNDPGRPVQNLHPFNVYLIVETVRTHLTNRLILPRGILFRYHKWVD